MASDSASVGSLSQLGPSSPVRLKMTWLKMAWLKMTRLKMAWFFVVPLHQGLPHVLRYLQHLQPLRIVRMGRTENTHFEAFHKQLAVASHQVLHAQGADGALIGGLYTQLWALAAFPIALAFGYRWITRGTSLAGAIGWGVFVGVSHHGLKPRVAVSRSHHGKQA